MGIAHQYPQSGKVHNSDAGRHMKILSGTSIVLLVLITLMLMACGSFAMHSVRKGESLYSISFHYGQDYKQVAEWNNIDPPYIIHPGQLIRVSPPQPGEQKPAASPTGRDVTVATSTPVNSSTPVTNPSVEQQATVQASNGIIVTPKQPPPV